MSRLLALALVLTTLGPAAWAAGPPTVNYQGVLRSATDAPLSGTYDMTFRFMDAASGGTEILVDRHQASSGNAVTVSGGLFNVELGGGTIADGSGPGSYLSLDGVFRDYGTVWLEVVIGVETLAPRTRALSAPYAMSATRSDTAATATSATNASQLGGQPASYYIDTAPGLDIKQGQLRLEANDPSFPVLEIISYGSSFSTIDARNDDGGTCRMLGNDHALECSSYSFQTYSGYFGNTSSLANVSLAIGAYGVRAGASFAPGDFQNFSGNIVHVGEQTYKVKGSGSVSFVQNHPEDPGRVIVYAAPEGDEVAVYTRGSGRLNKGEARVALGDTFPLVANPDVGLTASVTARGGKPIALSVASISTRELVVRGPVDEDAAFDYVVWGLRIGFEAQSIVQPKDFEAKIPSMKDHEAFFRQAPDLRGYTALERFKSMERDAFGKQSDLARADALKAKIGVAADHTPPNFLAGTPMAATVADPAAPAPPSIPSSPRHTSERQAARVDADRSDAATDRVVLPARGSVTTGDVVALDGDAPGYVRAVSEAGEPLLIGCAIASAGEGIAIATGRIASCRVDATTAPVAVGDRLIGSTNPGHAMRDDGAHANATVLGRAIDPLPGGTGTIRVLVTAR